MMQEVADPTHPPKPAQLQEAAVPTHPPMLLKQTTSSTTQSPEFVSSCSP